MGGVLSGMLSPLHLMKKCQQRFFCKRL